MLILEMLPRLYNFHFNIAVYLTTYLHRAVLTIYLNHYTEELLPLQQALLKRGKLTRFNLLVFKYYRVGRWELVY